MSIKMGQKHTKMGRNIFQIKPSWMTSNTTYQVYQRSLGDKIVLVIQLHTFKNTPSCQCNAEVGYASSIVWSFSFLAQKSDHNIPKGLMRGKRYFPLILSPIFIFYKVPSQLWCNKPTSRLHVTSTICSSDVTCPLHVTSTMEWTRWTRPLSYGSKCTSESAVSYKNTDNEGI